MSEQERLTEKENVAENINWINFSDKLKKHTQKPLKERYVVQDVRLFYVDLKDAKHDVKNLVKTLKLGKRYLESVMK